MSVERPVKRWIICINGFWQAEKQGTGIGLIHRDIHARCADRDTFVMLRTWKDSIRSLVERIWEWRSTDEANPTRIVLIGYSYGGYSAVLLADQLAKLGMEVESLVLVDAVWRLWASLPTLLSLRSWWRIRVPANVRQCWSWRQHVTSPSGHAVECESSETLLYQYTADVGHLAIDDLAEVREACLLAACPGRAIDQFPILQR